MVVRIVIADESEFVVAGLRAALEGGGMIVTAATRDAAETYAAVVEARPDAVVLAAQLPGGALETIERVRHDLPRTEFVLIADRADDRLMLRMVAAGARGFLLGQTDPGRLSNAVAGVLAGETAFPRRLVRAMADELARQHSRRAGLSPAGARLTGRQIEVLERLATGEAAHDVAHDLRISEATVRSHAATAARKLGARNRNEALRMLNTADRPNAEKRGSLSDETH